MCAFALLELLDEVLALVVVGFEALFAGLGEADFRVECEAAEWVEEKLVCLV